MSHVELNNVHVNLGGKTILDDLNLTLNTGELVALLGPSGCGKTTTLRALAGFTAPSAGQITIGDRDVTRQSVRERGLGIVFQAYSLFPHMTAAENVAYGLKIRGTHKAKRLGIAQDFLDEVDLAQHANKYPHQMSGGQQQRVALARALAIQPPVLLLDEPLSALDARVRVRLREMIRRVQKEYGITTLLVTHDQEEALTMADRIGVMSNGRIEQIGTADEIYNCPATPFAAEFVGIVNRIAARVDGGQAIVLGHSLDVLNEGANLGPRVEALIRPEDLSVVVDPQGPGIVRSTTLRGPYTSLDVQIPGICESLRVDLSSHEAAHILPQTKVAVRPLRRSALIDAPSLVDTPSILDTASLVA